MKKLYVGLVIIISLFISGFLFYNLYINDTNTKTDESQSNIKKELQKQILVESSFNNSNCVSDFPVFISIENNSDKTIEVATMYLDIYRKGYSFSINGSERMVSDKILEPNNKFQFCKKINLSEKYSEYMDKLEELETKIKLESVRINEDYIYFD